VPTATKTAVPRADDLAKANRAILKRADLDASFKETPYQPTPQADEDDAKLNACLGLPPSPTYQTAKVLSSQFSLGDKESILAGIDFVESQAVANRDLAAQQTSRALVCIKQSFQDQYERAYGNIRSIDIEKLDSSLARTAQAANYRLRVYVEQPDGTIPFTIDLLQALEGRAEVAAIFTEVNGSVSAALETRVIDAMLERLRS
jgi:hypothetical protein